MSKICSALGHTCKEENAGKGDKMLKISDGDGVIEWLRKASMTSPPYDPLLKWF